MADTPRHHQDTLTDWDPPIPSEAELLAALEESDADIAAGRFVSGKEIMRELQESIERMERKAAMAGARSGAASRR